MRVILRANRTTCTQYMRKTLGLLTLYNRRRFLRFVSIFKIVNNQNCPKQLEGYLTSRAELQNRNLRNQGTLDVPQSKTSSGRKTFQIAGASDWNSLDSLSQTAPQNSVNRSRDSKCRWRYQETSPPRPPWSQTNQTLYLHWKSVTWEQVRELLRCCNYLSRRENTFKWRCRGKKEDLPNEVFTTPPWKGCFLLKVVSEKW